MYPRIAVLLSVGGVLAAGSASALAHPDANGQAASSTSSASSVTAATTPNSSTPGSAASTVPDSLVVVGQPVPGSATQQSFRLGDAATVIVDTANGRLAIVVIAPHPGWTLTSAELRISESMEIRLESPNGEVRFDADIVGGAVVASLRVGDDTMSTTVGTGSTVSSGSTGSTIDDNDDNDDQTSSTIGNTVGTGSTGTTIDDGGRDNGSGSSGGRGDDDNNTSGSGDVDNSGGGGRD